MSKQFVAVLLAIVVGLGAVFVFTKDKSTTTNGGSSSGATLSNHVVGNNKKGVTLVEYGDFQCPACGAYYPVIKQVMEKYNDDISFQFRNFPLSQIHPNARAAHRAAEAADKQGKFWEMYDLLYTNQKSWESLSDPVETFNGYATQLGLNAEKYKQDYQSSEVNAIINADLAEGQKLQVNSTPTFILQGKILGETPRDVEGFSKIIDEAIKAAEKK